MERLLLIDADGHCKSVISSIDSFQYDAVGAVCNDLAMGHDLANGVIVLQAFLGLAWEVG